MDICLHKRKVSMCSQKILNLGETDYRLVTVGYVNTVSLTNPSSVSLKQLKNSVRGERNLSLLPVVS